MFPAAKVIEKRLSRTKANQFVDEYNSLDKYMSTGKVNETIRSVTEETTAVVFSLTHKIDKKTAHFVLCQKHSITTQSYLVGNNRKNNLSDNQFIFEKLNVSNAIKSDR